MPHDDYGYYWLSQAELDAEMKPPKRKNRALPMTSDAAVEAMCRAVHKLYDMGSYDDEDEENKEDGRKMMRAALAAAMPHIRKEVVEEAVKREGVTYVTELADGQCVVCHPKIPPHVWDGEKMVKLEAFLALAQDGGR